MYDGQVMEVRDAGDLEHAEHPYTRGLLNCLPQVGKSDQALPVLERDPAWSEYRGSQDD